MDISTCVGKDNHSSALVELVNGRPTTTSNVIAGAFGKRHDRVLRAIRNLECSPDFHALNFGEIQTDVDLGRGRIRKDPSYLVTKDGFVFLAMGFTGKEAAKWKEAYINAFNLMESELLRIRDSAKALPNGLEPAQQRKLQEAVSAKAKELPKNLQPAAFPQLWGGLKSHFRVGTYKDLSNTQFEAALSFIESYEWELVGEPAAPVLKGDYHFPLSAADPHDRRFGNAWLTPAVLIDPKNRALELEVVDRLEKEGFDVMGLKMRILALRDAVENAEKMRLEWARMANSLEVLQERARVQSASRGKNVSFTGKPNPNDPIDRHVFKDQIAA